MIERRRRFSILASLSMVVILTTVAGASSFAADPSEKKSSKAGQASKSDAPAKKKKSTVVRKPNPVDDPQVNDVIQRHLQILDFANSRLSHIGSSEAECIDCLASSAGTGDSTLDKKSPLQICKDKWADFYSKDTIDIRFVFGYDDWDKESIVDDLTTQETFISQLTSSCEDEANWNLHVCGFERTDSKDVLEKQVEGPNGKIHTVRVRLTASSYSTSERINKAFADEQRQASARAADVYCGGMKDADALMYVGHARDGGGPDFGPAKRRADGSKDYDYYRKEQPGLKFVNDCIAKSKTPPKIAGFFACDAERWGPSMIKALPKSGLIMTGTKSIPTEISLAQSYAALDSILWQRCEGAFNRALNFQVPGKSVLKYGDKRILPLSIEGFFKP